MSIRLRPAVVALLSVLLLAAYVAPAGADPTGSMLQADCDEPPAIMPVADIESGMTGKAYTTLEGREISEFDVEVLGVLPGAIYPLIDLIIVEISGPAVEAVGGLAGGFSGSPVYIDGKLIGAIAYGFFGNSFLAGVTPAEAMADLLAIPASTPPSVNAAATGMVDASVASLGAPQPLPMPIGIGGVSPAWLERIQAELEVRGLPFTVYPAAGSGSGGGAAGPPGRVLPGESLSAVLSEGDNFAFGTGTATYCDGDTILGFGHPFLWTGEVTMSMNEADVVTVVEDATGFGNFKLTTLGEQAGRVDFDGNAGIRGINGEAAPSVPITSSVEFGELGATRNGRTDVYVADDPFFSLGNTAAFHLLTNLDHVSGTGFRPGSSTVEWQVEGTRADGSSFSAGFDNQYWDPFSITDSSIFELAYFIDQLLFNPFEDVRITSVDIGTGELFSERRTLDFAEVRVWTTSNPEPVEEFGFLQAQPGDTVTVEVDLRPFGGDVFTETLELLIPEDFPGGFGSLFVHGGSSDFFFFDPFFDGFFDGDVDDFDSLLEFLEGRDHNYDLVAELELFPEGVVEEPPPDEGPEPPDGFVEANGPVPGGNETLRLKEVVEFDAVVNGDAFFDFEVFPEFVPPPVIGTLFASLSGEDVPGGGDPDGSGSAVLNFDGDLVSFDMSLDGVDDPITGVHIHAGFAGEEGPVVLDLDYESNGLSGAVLADPFLLEEMLFFPEGFYLQVHTEAYPTGAVRGQLATELVAGVTREAATLAYVGAGGLWQTAGSDPFFFGVPGDTPFLGDWDGDGVKTPGLYRPSSGFAYLRNSNTTGFADSSFFMGMKGDVPMVGDWDGDGVDTFGVYRPAEAKVYLRNSNDTGIADVEYSFGHPGDVPFTGDFNGDGVTDVGLHRPSTGLVYLRTTHTTGVADTTFYWGVGGDVVMAGDWDGDGIDTVGLVRPDAGMFYLRNQNSSGIADDLRPLVVAETGVQVIVN
jgi:hypothetical protein